MNPHLRHLLGFLCLSQGEKRIYVEQWPKDAKYNPSGSGPAIADPFLALMVETHDEIEKALPFASTQSKQLLTEIWALLGAMLYFRRLDPVSDYWWRNEVSKCPSETQLSVLWKIVERLSLAAIGSDVNMCVDRIPSISDLLKAKLTVINYP